jgi:hypothetical protein
MIEIYPQARSVLNAPQSRLTRVALLSVLFIACQRTPSEPSPSTAGTAPLRIGSADRLSRFSSSDFHQINQELAFYVRDNQSDIDQLEQRGSTTDEQRVIIAVLHLVQHELLEAQLIGNQLTGKFTSLSDEQIQERIDTINLHLETAIRLRGTIICQQPQTPSIPDQQQGVMQI